jgi:hypothetical protein
MNIMKDNKVDIAGIVFSFLKKHKKLIKGLVALGLVTFIAETSFLFYIDKYYLAEEQSFTMKNKEPKVSNEPKKPVVEEKKLLIKMPEQYKDFRVSYDGAYVSYFEGTNLKIVSMKDGSSSDINFDGDVAQSYYGWLDDRNRIIITEKKLKDSKWGVRFYYYDIKSKEKVEVKDFIHEKDVVLPLDGKDSEVSKIEFNTLNTIIYPHISANDKESKIYRVDATAPIELVKTQTKEIGDIRVVKSLDKIAYEDKQNKKVYLSDNKTPIAITGVTEYKLLSVDEQSKIYIGSIKNEMIDKIYYKNLKDKDAEWISSNLDTPVSNKSIFITSAGEIFIDHVEKSVIQNISNSKEFKYEGKILGAYNEGAILLNSKNEISSLNLK